MRTWRNALLLTAIATVGCEHEAKVEESVRAFMLTVAHDITQEGPAAWRRHFPDSPALFMAADGHLAFAIHAAAMAPIPELVRTIKQIELRWGDDLRVDP